MPLNDNDRRTWAMAAHIGPLVVGFWAPLVIWLVYKDRDAFVRDQAAEALNFQFAMWVAVLISIPLMFVVIGFFTLIATSLAAFVLHIIAGIAAYDRRAYRYPVAIRLLH